MTKVGKRIGRQVGVGAFNRHTNSSGEIVLVQKLIKKTLKLFFQFKPKIKINVVPKRPYIRCSDFEKIFLAVATSGTTSDSFSLFLSVVFCWHAIQQVVFLPPRSH